jgi:hypothetical protein
MLGVMTGDLGQIGEVAVGGTLRPLPVLEADG